MAKGADPDEAAADRADLRGWLMFAGFGLLWTLASGAMATLIVLSSLGIIGRDPEPVNLFVYRTGRGKTHVETVFETTTSVAIVASGQKSIIRTSLVLPEKRRGTWWLEVKAPALLESFELPAFEATEVERFSLP